MRSRLKEQTSVASLKGSGRLFQSVASGAHQTENNLSRYLVMDRGTISRPLDEDRNGRGGTYLSSSSVIYVGASPLSALNGNTRI